MERRSWPWKKKSSEKNVTLTNTPNTNFASPGEIKTDEDDTETINYVQISVESYAHLTGLEDKVKILTDNISNLTESLSSAQSEMVIKDTLVKQHTKVAEEAVSGWEKAEVEAMALKQQLESVTLLRLTAENRASHLDGALKECMKQVHHVKEESEQKLHDVIFAKSKQWEKAEAELDAKILNFEQELLRSSAENAALSRSLQERSNLLMKINDEKNQSNAEIEILKNNIKSYEREINSLKYELHVVSKELEIRNEEKNMSMKSADVANKQHLEDIKKISKLEAECQRLRGLVRKRLPGPAALAQMKMEVENLGRECGDPRLRRSPTKISSPYHVSPSDFAIENMQQCRKENEFLTARMLTMEEEMKMLKEALSKRNSELQASRNMCAKTANRLRIVDAHYPEKLISEIPFEIESIPTSLTSMSEDGIDEEGSSDSWANAVISEFSQLKKDSNIDKSNNKVSRPNQLELMDDFLEMEKLAYEATEIDKSITASVFSNMDQPLDELQSNKDNSPLSKLQSRISSLFESHLQNADIGKLLEDISDIVHDAHEELPDRSVDSVVRESHSDNDTCMQKECKVCTEKVTENMNIVMVQDLKDAISQIHEFVVLMGKEATKIHSGTFDDSVVTKKMEELTTSVHTILSNETSMHDFILALSQILSEKVFLDYIVPCDMCSDKESYSSDCVDKVALLENKVSPKEHCLPDFRSSDPEIDGLSFEFKNAMQKCSMEEFEQIKSKKENAENDLARCTEILEETNQKLVEMEQQVSKLKLQVAASEKSNALAETQLKCMAESYKNLESQKQEIDIELKRMAESYKLLEYQKQEMEAKWNLKVEFMEKELLEEKNSHQDELVKYKDLQEQMERNESSACLVISDAEIDIKEKQEREIAAATEKLAECQETIFLLGRQLKSLCPSSDSVGSPNNTLEDDGQIEMEDIPDNESGPFTKSHLHSKSSKHKSSKSSSSSTFSRFFSKGNNEN